MAKKFPTVLPEFKLKKRHVKLLKYARNRVRDGLNDALCGAISMGATRPLSSGVTQNHQKASRAAGKLRSYIMEAIEGSVYLEGWQRRKRMGRSSEQSRNDRVKWVNHILKNAERK